MSSEKKSCPIQDGFTGHSAFFRAGISAAAQPRTTFTSKSRRQAREGAWLARAGICGGGGDAPPPPQVANVR